MCGIFGSIELNQSSNFATRLSEASNALSHRGPNDNGLEISCLGGVHLSLGHRRLSIFDLSERGHQPMSSASNRFVTVFNGEIYNYRELREQLISKGYCFKTDTDTEVLLAAWEEWGAGSLHHFSGMFAFAIYDNKSKQITFVRDAFGIKPLYYYFDQNAFYFASEIPALLKLIPHKVGANLNRGAQYILSGTYDNSSETFYDGVFQLLPGHTLTINLDSPKKVTPMRWWWPEVKERSNLSFPDAVDQLRSLFLETIRLHLRSDVPVGATLSGGIDSSAVVCAMRYLEPKMPLKTFSFIASGHRMDEEKWVDIVNAHVGAQSIKVGITSAELAEDIDDLIATQGEPFCTTSIYAQYRVFKMVRESGVVVTLDGQGADEMLAGYGGYPEARIKSLIENKQWRALLVFLNGWGKQPGRTISQSVRLAIRQFVPDSFVNSLHAFRANPDANLFNRDAHHFLKLSSPLAKDDIAGQTIGGRRLVEALRNALCFDGINALLRHGDRNSMRWSIESRVPFLTTKMSEFCLSLPEDYLVSKTGETKCIFRAAMRGIVPDVILDRKDKIGFETPEEVWLTKLGSKAAKWMESAENIPFLNPLEVRAEINLVINGHKHFSPKAWRLINYCKWFNRS